MQIPRIRLTREKALSASTEVLEAVQDRRTQFYPRLGGTNRNVQVAAAFERGQSAAYGWLYINRPAVRTVVDYIARNMAQLPLKLYEKLGDTDRRERSDSVPAEVMEYPDGETPFNQFIFSFIADYLVYDNAYLVKFRPPDENGRLIMVRNPPYLTTLTGGRFRVDTYRIWRFDGSFIDLPPEDVIHWHGYNPDDPLMGVSRLETLRETLSEDAASQAATVELMKHGLKGGHIERPLEAPEWTPEAMDRFSEQWANQRTASPRRDPILEEGMKWVPTAISPKDAELLAGRRFTVEEVARIYGVHPRLLGLSEGGSSTEIEDLRRQFYTDTLPPYTKPLESQFDTDVLREEYLLDDYYFEFNMNEKLRGDPDKRFQAITAAVGRPWMLVDEARALENRAPVEGGDELTIPLNVALGSLPAPNVMPPQDPLKPPQDGSHREGEAEARQLQAKTGEGLPAVPELASGEDTPSYAKRAVEALFERYFERQTRSLSEGTPFDFKRWNRELCDDLYVMLREVSNREGTRKLDPRAPDDPDLKALAKGAAEAINDFVWRELEHSDPATGMTRVKRRFGGMADRVVAQSIVLATKQVATLGPGLQQMMPQGEHPTLESRDRLERLTLLRQLGLPDEVIWDLAGFTAEEIEHFRRLAHTHELTTGLGDADEPPIAEGN